MASRLLLLPNQAVQRVSEFAPRRVGMTNSRRTALAYDDTNISYAWWEFIAPTPLVLPISAVLHLSMVSATSGNVVFACIVEAMKPGDNMNNASLATDIGAPLTAVPGTAGYLFTITVPLVNHDNMAAGDQCHLCVYRNGADSSDTASSFAYLWGVEFRGNE